MGCHVEHVACGTFYPEGFFMLLTPTAGKPGDRRPPMQPELLDVMAVATLLSCSPRHVLRMARSGRMPPPVKVGRLRRWSCRSIELWIANGGSDAAKEVSR